MKSVNTAKLPDNRLPKAAYEIVKSLDDKRVKTWASDIRTCLFQYGFEMVRISQVGNKTGFLRELKQRLIDCYAQDWHEKMSTTKKDLKITEALNKYYNSRATFRISQSKDTGAPEFEYNQR